MQSNRNWNRLTSYDQVTHTHTRSRTFTLEEGTPVVDETLARYAGRNLAKKITDRSASHSHALVLIGEIHTSIYTQSCIDRRTPPPTTLTHQPPSLPGGSFLCGPPRQSVAHRRRRVYHNVSGKQALVIDDTHSMSFLLLKYFRKYSTCQVASPSRHSMEKMEK